MQVGAVGAMSYSPYIYNTNTVNRASMNKISGISDDLLESKTDFSALSNETTNPIKRGQSLDFAGIMQMQMSMSRLNASRVMKTPESDEEARQAAGVKSVTEEASVKPATEAATSQVASASEVATASQVASVGNVAEAGAVATGSEVVSQISQGNGSNQTASTFDYAAAMAAYQPIDMYA